MRGVVAVAIVIGIPIGLPFQRPAPKSGWRWPATPIDAMYALELGSSGIESTRWFQAFILGNTGHAGAPGSRAAAVAPASANVATARAARLRRTVLFSAA